MRSRSITRVSKSSPPSKPKVASERFNKRGEVLFRELPRRPGRAQRQPILHIRFGNAYPVSGEPCLHRVARRGGIEEHEQESIHRGVHLLRRMLLHQQAGEEEKAHHAYLSPENRAFIALPAGAMASKKKVRGSTFSHFRCHLRFDATFSGEICACVSE